MLFPLLFDMYFTNILLRAGSQRQCLFHHSFGSDKIEKENKNIPRDHMLKAQCERLWFLKFKNINKPIY